MGNGEEMHAPFLGCMSNIYAESSEVMLVPCMSFTVTFLCDIQNKGQCFLLLPKHLHVG